MSFASKHNKAGWDFEVPKGLEYTTLKDLYENNGKNTEYTIRALYINDGKFGRQPTVIATLGSEAVKSSFQVIKVSLPSHLTDEVESMRSDSEDVQSINDGMAGFTIYKYESKNGRTCYSVNWVDMTQF